MKTYVEARWRAAHAAGHHVDVIAPSARDHVTTVEGGSLIEVRAPTLFVDPRYHIFWSRKPVEDALRRCNPDLIEASSPWRALSLAAEYPASLPRTLFMHEEPVLKYPYRWFDWFVPRKVIDRLLVPWFWHRLKKYYARYDALVFAAPSIARRLNDAGVMNTVTIPMGVDAGIFSPRNRDERLRADLLARMGLPESATLIIAIGRLVSEKRWPTIINAFQSVSATAEVGLIALGGGYTSARVAKRIGDDPHIMQMSPIANRAEYARTIASADMFFHASNAETFGLAAAEALASGLPMVIPDEGAVIDQADPAYSETYPAADSEAAARTIHAMIARLPAARQAAARKAAAPRTLDQHFTDLFADYEHRIAAHGRGPCHSR